ncbi:hypothetical protein D1007_50392 [Hordeum vulgare]|nr:hypothetical protein D1007_50392 [Hordeum vulgare]
MHAFVLRASPRAIFQDVRPPFIPAAINHNLFMLSIVHRNTINTPSMTHTERIYNGAAMEFDVHLVETHMRKMDLMMVYTNDPVMMEDSINTMERFLVEDDKYKVFGFGLAYTGSRVVHDQKVVVAQLCMHHHVLLYHYYMAIVPCEYFTKFVNSPDYRFAMVDTTND